MDIFAEKMRFRINSRLDCTENILVIGVFEKTVEFVLVPYEFNPNYDDFLTFLNEGEVEEFVFLDMYKQSSGIRFDKVYLIRPAVDEYENTRGFNHVFLPMMKTLRLKCETYVIAAEWARSTMTVRSLVECSHFLNYSLASLEDYQPIRHLTEHYFGFSIDVPPNLATTINHLRRAHLTIANDEAMSTFEHFLEEVSQNSSARGNLEFVSIEVYFSKIQWKLSQIDSSVWLTSGCFYIKDKFRDLEIYRMDIANGKAIIMRWCDENRYDIHFLNKWDRMTLLGTVAWELYFQHPIDFSVNSDAFFDAEDDVKALQCFYPYEFIRF